MLYGVADRPSAAGRWRTDLWLLALDGGSPRRLTQDHAVNQGAFTPDGQSIVFSSSRSGRAHIYEMRLDGPTEPTQLSFGDGSEYVPDVSPDGRLVLYQVDQGSLQLFAQPLAGGPHRQLTSRIDSLGLQLVHDLAAQPSGEIEVSRDGGTMFTVTCSIDARGGAR